MNTSEEVCQLCSALARQSRDAFILRHADENAVTPNETSLDTGDICSQACAPVLSVSSNGREGLRAGWGWHISLQETPQRYQTGPMMLPESTYHAQSDNPGHKGMRE